MKRKRYSDEQIAFALRRAENGTLVEEVCRKLGVSEATFYRWKKQFAGMGVVEIRRLKQLEEENAKLKRLWWRISASTRRCCRTFCAEMYGPPRRCKALWVLTFDSLRKCIRPLASGLLLQPGHDEIRARRFH